MGKIGDLFVRLGLKNDDFKKGMKEAKTETEGFGSKLNKVKGAAVAAWAAIGAAVMKVGHDILNATNTMGDAWAQTMGKMKASYQSMLAQLSTASKTKDKGWWLRLFNPNDTTAFEVGANAKAAGEAAKKMIAAFDAEFELANSIKLQRGAIQKELNELYVQMRDTTLSPQARKAAQERYKTLLTPLAEAEVNVYSDMVEAAVTAWQAGNSDLLSRKYTSDEMREFFSMYGTDPNAAKAKYGELANVYENRQNDETNSLIVETFAKLDQAKNEISNIEKEMGRTTISINKQLADQAALLPNAMQESLDMAFEEIDNFEDDIEDIEIEIPEIKTDALDKGLKDIQENAERYREELAKIEQYNGMIEDAIISATQNSMQALTDMIFGVQEADMKQVLAAFLTPFGDTMKQMGSMIMAEGIAMDAFKKSFKNPYAAIAAGAALIAVGSAVSSGLQALTANPTGGGTTASAGSSTMNTPQNYESTLTVEVKGKISGNDIVISGKKTTNSNNR